MTEQPYKSERGHMELPNKGEIIENPRFVCEKCGLANVELIDIDGAAAAKCTNCGVGYLEVSGQ